MALHRMVRVGDLLADCFKKRSYVVTEVKDDGIAWMRLNGNPDAKPTCFIARFSDGSLNLEFEIIPRSEP